MTNPPAGFSRALDDLRALGWSVAVHNDYRQQGEAHTFWLLTHPNGRWIKGEGKSDSEALAALCIAAAAPATMKPTMTREWFERKAKLEGDFEVSAGMLASYLPPALAASAPETGGDETTLRARMEANLCELRSAREEYRAVGDRRAESRCSDIIGTIEGLLGPAAPLPSPPPSGDLRELADAFVRRWITHGSYRLADTERYEAALAEIIALAQSHGEATAREATERAAQIAERYVELPVGGPAQDTSEAFAHGLNYRAGGMDNAIAIVEAIRTASPAPVTAEPGQRGENAGQTATQPKAISDFKWLDPNCVVEGCQSLVLHAALTAARASGFAAGRESAAKIAGNVGKYGAAAGSIAAAIRSAPAGDGGR